MYLPPKQHFQNKGQTPIAPLKKRKIEEENKIRAKQRIFSLSKTELRKIEVPSERLANNHSQL